MKGACDSELETKGRVFAVLPGIEFAFYRIDADGMTCQHDEGDAVLAISHCRAGRMDWKTHEGGFGSLCGGDVSVHALACSARSELSFPLGYYEGVTVFIDLHGLEESKTEILEEADVDCLRLYQTLCPGGKPTTIPSNGKLDGIFSAMYDLPQTVCMPYYKLKVQEILILLSLMGDAEIWGLDRTRARQTDGIKEIHDLLIQNLNKRFTIEELSKRYLINTSSLKSTFKAVYGLPISAYVKEYRIKKAMELLRDTTDSIAEIAAAVGYRTQSKFTQAFKGAVGMLPTAYRKHCQQSRGTCRV